MRRPIDWIVVCISLLFLAVGRPARPPESAHGPPDSIVTVIDEFGIPRTMRSAPELDGLGRGALATPLPSNRR